VNWFLRHALSYALVAAGTVAIMHAGVNVFRADAATWTAFGLVVLGNVLFRVGLAAERFKTDEVTR
jgi:hypothetical protein